MSSSRFVSGGTTDAPTARDEEWRLAQANLDAKQAARLEASQRQQTGKSLYETLQANKGCFSPFTGTNSYTPRPLSNHVICHAPMRDRASI